MPTDPRKTLEEAADRLLGLSERLFGSGSHDEGGPQPCPACEDRRMASALRALAEAGGHCPGCDGWQGVYTSSDTKRTSVETPCPGLAGGKP